MKTFAKVGAVLALAMAVTHTAHAQDSVFSFLASDATAEQREYNANADRVLRVGIDSSVNIRNYVGSNTNGVGAESSGTQGGVEYADHDNVWGFMNNQVAAGGTSGDSWDVSCKGSVGRLSPEDAEVYMAAFNRSVEVADGDATATADALHLTLEAMRLATGSFECFPARRGAPTTTPSS